MVRKFNDKSDKFRMFGGTFSENAWANDQKTVGHVGAISDFLIGFLTKLFRHLEIIIRKPADKSNHFQIFL